MNGQLHAPAALPPGKDASCAIGQEDRWAPEPVWAIRSENSWSYWDSSSDLSVVQPVVSRYIDFATAAHRLEPVRCVIFLANDSKYFKY
jgi:hypothetical protein